MTDINLFPHQVSASRNNLHLLSILFFLFWVMLCTPAKAESSTKTIKNTEAATTSSDTQSPLIKSQSTQTQSIKPEPAKTQLTETQLTETQVSQTPLTKTVLNQPDLSKDVEKINAAYWLRKLRTALRKGQFEAGIVRQKGEKTESYKWLHGVVEVEQESGELQAVEVEQVSQLVGGVGTMIRRDNTIALFDANNEPYAVNGNSIRNFIPPIFYRDAGALIDSYQFVLVSKSQIAGRSAQLIRIESIKRQTYNYWMWIDVESGLPLRMVYVDDTGDVVEQIIMTHLSVFNAPTPDMKKLAVMSLPNAPLAVAPTQQANNWKVSYLPKGFELIKSDRHHVSISREVSDYYLFSDGLVEFSIYVQRPLDNFSSPVVLTDGATSFVMIHADSIDVTVVGTIPPKTAYAIAQGVKAK